MPFNSIEFILFFSLIYVLYRLLPHTARNTFLLLASYLFYASWSWTFLWVIALTTCVHYWCGWNIEKIQQDSLRKLYLWIGIILSISMLAFFKCHGFFIDDFQQFLHSFDINVRKTDLKFILPIGISFYTFQSLSYIIDIFWKKIKPEPNFFHFALFVAFFPQLLAGPIERAGHLMPQINNKRKITTMHIQQGLWFIYWGYFLKIFVANNLAKTVDLIYDQNRIIPGIEAILGGYAFTFQVFSDFAGYSFIAIGLGSLFGFHLHENFRFPFFVSNPRDFWRNWHITLYDWFYDYLFTPLAIVLRRFKNAGIFLAMTTTLILSGLWHGITWVFIFWGCIHSFILIVYYAFRPIFPIKSSSKFSKIIKIIISFHLIVLTSAIFRMESMEQLYAFSYSVIFNLHEFSYRTHYFLFNIIFYSLFMLTLLYIQKKKDDLLAILKMSPLKISFILLTMFYLTALFGEFGGENFIYFQF